MNTKKILIVDDDPIIARFLSEFLQLEGYLTDVASDGFETLDKVQTTQPNLVLLDVMLPQMDGFETCAKLRGFSDVPIIFLTAKDTTTDKVMGFTFGSDDYVTKPFDSAELLMRIKAVLKRVPVNLPVNQPQTEVIYSQGLVVNKTARQVKVAGNMVELTTKEFDLLWLLASHPNRVFTREQLVQQVWNVRYMEDSGMVNVLIRRLREKVEADPGYPEHILTIRGVGYKFGNQPC